MRVLSTVLAAAFAPLLIAAQASAQGQAPAAPQPAAKTSYLDKVVCKKFPPPVGTRLGERKICKTQADWDMIRQQEYEALDRVQGRKATNGG